MVVRWLFTASQTLLFCPDQLDLPSIQPAQQLSHELR